MLTAVVVAHPKRIEWARDLAEQVGATVVLDTEGLGAGGNHRRALQVGLDTGADHILSLEDDALPVPDLMRHVADAIEHRPGGDGLIGLYVGQQRPSAEHVTPAVRGAEESGAAWLTYPGLLWGVATLWPRALASEYLGTKHKGNLWDVPVKRWCKDRGHVVAYCYPSLVEHRDEAPVIAHPIGRPAGRVAHRVGVPNWNDLSVAM